MSINRLHYIAINNNMSYFQFNLMVHYAAGKDLCQKYMLQYHPLPPKTPIGTAVSWLYTNNMYEIPVKCPFQNECFVKLRKFNLYLYYGK